MEEIRFLLGTKDMPKSWYNILPDLPRPLDPPLNPATKQPIGPDALAALFPMALIEQEVSQKTEIPIPPEVLDIYALWRPTPVRRARRLEQMLDTPAKIFYKDESVSASGSHKLNTATAQAFYNKKDGTKRITTETGAGQWGSALSIACSMFGIECRVYMVKVSYQQKPYRRSMMQVFGAEVIPSPSKLTKFGTQILKDDPDCTGSLGIAISEAIEDCVTSKNTRYSLGSVLNHVLLHQTIVGLEAKKQMELAGTYPDYVIGCVGGGSNYAGLALPFMRDKLKGGKKTTFIAVEPQACPTITKGKYAYDHGDTAKMTPLLKQHTLGHIFVPPAIHAGGLRYHGMAGIISLLCKEQCMEAVAYHQNEVFKNAMIFAQAEGVIPAPETSHAIMAAMEVARECKKTGEAKTILFNFSGHGYFDMGAYDAYLSGKLEDYEYPQHEIEEALKCLPVV
ncbi:MAG: TrpB-like pyridoxal phosphate-dependent enzyme [Candidatus Abyssobacteria bacterium SURF_17]|uniref:Tryptophan synthase beta chain n=1 Tax=Candidatus Abyssobacteria bacterium SURF_17 TaxID=2093361 RepID=A0A419ET11_9BACT|nr:MAG: TrpB-like pyridoxal phosphate-dependent enzyme [Candidatus Abyssubacteria bacterium SURF_17]